jgi:hypothetical protein
MKIRIVHIGALISMLLFAGCPGNKDRPDSSYECQSCNQLTKQNDDLRQSILEKDNKIEELEGEIINVREKKGYLLIATWVAVLAAFGLLSVGLAIGVKIKDEIITH